MDLFAGGGGFLGASDVLGSEAGGAEVAPLFVGAAGELDAIGGGAAVAAAVVDLEDTDEVFQGFLYRDPGFEGFLFDVGLNGSSGEGGGGEMAVGELGFQVGGGVERAELVVGVDVEGPLREGPDGRELCALLVETSDLVFDVADLGFDRIGAGLV